MRLRLRKILRKQICLMLTVLLMAALPVVCAASSAQSQLEEANEAAQELEEEQDELESQIASYEASLSELAQELTDIVAQISEKQTQIDETQAEIEVLAASEEEKRELICARAQYVYENSGTSALQILLSSTSFADFLNKVQFLNELNEYDNNLIAQYNEACLALAEKKEILEEEKAQLEEMRNASLEKQTQLYDLIETANTQLADTQSALDSISETVSELEAQIEAASAAADAAQAQKIQAELASSSSSSSGSSASEDSTEESSSSGSSSYTDYSGSTYSGSTDDLTLLAALIYCEAGGESYEGQLAVGSVVMNRVYSSSFPDTISGVIYQSGQFSPASNGRLASCLASGSYTTSCVNAAQEVMNGNLTVTALFFCSVSSYSGTGGTVIGNHVFY